MSVSVANRGRELSTDVSPRIQTFSSDDDDGTKDHTKTNYDACEACDDTCALMGPGVILFGADDAERTPSAKVGLFDVCESCDAICLTGCVTPCCLIGATMKNAHTRQDAAGPCDGCGAHCCTAYLLSVLEMSSFPFMTVLYQYFCVRPTVRGYTENEAGCSVCVAYIFCYRCAVCQDYKTSTRGGEKSR